MSFFLFGKTSTKQGFPQKQDIALFAMSWTPRNEQDIISRHHALDDAAILGNYPGEGKRGTQLRQFVTVGAARSATWSSLSTAF